MIGYFVESVLGLVFGIGFAIYKPTSSESIQKGHLTAHKLLDDGCKSFFQCCVYFAVSTQIACAIVLIRRDFGISANGLGGFTVQIVWAIALLCMLPLMYPMVILEYTDAKKSNYRLFLFSGCWLLFIYTFISQMIGNFAPDQVGEGAGPGGSTIISTDEYSILWTLCFAEAKTLSLTEQKVLSAFGAVGSIIITAYGLGSLLWFIWKGLVDKKSVDSVRGAISSRFSHPNRDRYILIGLNATILGLTIPQAWGVMRLREIQRSLAEHTNNVYVDNQWTFGQVVAVILFAPVIIEVGYARIDKSPKT